MKELKYKNLPISIIMPTYNSAKSIQKMLDSMMSSLKIYDGYEILIVDDGSTDDTCKIIKEYNKKNNYCIKYYKIKNSGPFLARLNGLEHAIKEYVYFVDSDDFLSNDFFFNVYDAISLYPSDIYLISLCRTSNNSVSTIYSAPNRNVEQSEYINKLIITGEIGYTPCKIFKKNLFNQYSEDVSKYGFINYSEDLLLSLFFYKPAMRIRGILNSTYFYLDNSHSLSNVFTVRKIKSICSVFEMRYKFLSKECDEFISNFLNNASFQLLYYYKSVLLSKDLSLKDKRICLIMLKNVSFNKKEIYNFEISEYGYKYKFLYYFLVFIRKIK